jgi:carnitine O-acetyltransferase
MRRWWSSVRGEGEVVLASWTGRRADGGAALPKAWRAHQKAVPAMPVPPLADTLLRYKAYLEPLLGAQDLARVSRIVDRFAGSEEAAVLQDELHRLAAAVPGGWWIEGIWDAAYLAPRAPVVFNSNPFFVLAPSSAAGGDGAGAGLAQVERAAQLAHAWAAVAAAMRAGSLAPDMERTTPLCMKQYPKLFGVGRVALPGRDELHAFPRSRHAVAMLRGHMLALEVLRPDGEPHSAAALRASLEAAIAAAPQGPASAPVGALSADGRDEWASARAALAAKSPRNRAALAALDSALFVLNLDDVQPASDEALSHAMLHGAAPGNRYFDKLQLTVLPDGTAAVNFEHAPIDGHTVLRLVHEARDYLRRGPENARPRAAQAGATGAPDVVLLAWDTDAQIMASIERARDAFNRTRATVDLSPLRFTDYGKKQIVAWKRSPDAFAQMAFQLATARTLGRQVSTYESAMTKRFDSGRTETLRSVTPESVAMVRTFAPAAGATPAQRAAALRVACDAHTARMNEAKNGLGVDRHMYALSKLASVRRGLMPEFAFKVPEIFTHPSFSTLMTSVLSTSNCGSDALDLFGFGAVVDHGLGVGYFINDASMTFVASSFHGAAKGIPKSKAHSFAANLDATLKEFAMLPHE